MLHYQYKNRLKNLAILLSGFYSLYMNNVLILTEAQIQRLIALPRTVIFPDCGSGLRNLEKLRYKISAVRIKGKNIFTETLQKTFGQIFKAESCFAFACFNNRCLAVVDGERADLSALFRFDVHDDIVAVGDLWGDFQLDSCLLEGCGPYAATFGCFT